MKTDWESLSRQLHSRHGNLPLGDEQARQAMELILGDAWVDEAVEVAIAGPADAARLAMLCLRQLHSASVARRAYDIYCVRDDPERQLMAVRLLRDLAHPSSLAWVDEFLHDPHVLGLGLDLLDQLLWTEAVSYAEHEQEIEALLETALQESLCGQQEKVDFIRQYLEELS